MNYVRDHASEDALRVLNEDIRSAEFSVNSRHLRLAQGQRTQGTHDGAVSSERIQVVERAMNDDHVPRHLIWHPLGAKFGPTGCEGRKQAKVLGVKPSGGAMSMGG